MVELYGRKLSRREVSAHAGALSQFAGVRLMTLGDGVERGVRMLEFRTGTGLRFTVLVDRALDIADCEYKGMAIGWHSPAGFRHPGLHEYEGEGGLAWLRSFSGLLVTCGLDHILVHVRRAGRPLRLRPAQDASATRSTAASARSRRGSPAMASAGTATSACSGRGHRAAVDGLRRGPASHPPHRGEGRHERDPAARPRRQSRLLPDAAHVLLPHQCRPSGAGRGLALPRADRATWSGRRMPATTIASRASATGRMPAPQLNFHEQVWQHELAADAGRAKCRSRSSTTRSASASRW